VKGRTALASRPSTPAAAVAASVRSAAALRARRRGRWIRAGLAVLVAGVVAALVWALFFSALIAVRTVNVAGTSRLTPAEVTAAAKVPRGGSLALLDTRAVAARTRSLPAVESVKVERRLLHTVRLVITERTPVLVLDTVSGRQLVDASGVAFAAASDADAAGLPVVRTALLTLPQSTLVSITAMLAALPASVRADAQVVRADSADAMSVELTDGRLVIWGDNTRQEFKAQVLSVLIHRKGRAYDVSTPEAPAITR
jgi:cell division protein FtsQ